MSITSADSAFRKHARSPVDYTVDFTPTRPACGAQLARRLALPRHGWRGTADPARPGNRPARLHRQHGQHRPDGRTGWYVHWRTTSKVLGIDPFRMLKIIITALPERSSHPHPVWVLLRVRMLGLSPTRRDRAGLSRPNADGPGTVIVRRPEPLRAQ